VLEGEYYAAKGVRSKAVAAFEKIKRGSRYYPDACLARAKFAASTKEKIEAYEEFFGMVTGGRKPPPGLGGGGKLGAATDGTSIPPPTGQSVVQARNAKKTALDEFARDNNIKPESVKKAYKRFQATDKDKSGMIDYTEFCEVLQVDPSPQCEKVFQMYDYDKSGQIDVREFMIGLANFTGAGKDDKLKFAFMIFDEEGNGVITKGELTKILKANHMASSEAEVARKADTIMAQADKDGDGVVTFEEFVIVSKKFPNILFPSMAGGDKK
jgi:serine/threonine-protein phosphatase 2B regulatory subunit